MKKYAEFTLIMLLSSCTLFKRTSETKHETFDEVNRVTDLQAFKDVKVHKGGQELITRKDNTGTEYSMRLWPKGSVSLMPAGTISGNFDSILVTGKHKMSASTFKETNTNEDATEKNNLLVSEKEQHGSGAKLTEKAKSPQKNVLVILAVVAVLVIFLWRTRVFWAKIFHF